MFRRGAVRQPFRHESFFELVTVQAHGSAAAPALDARSRLTLPCMELADRNLLVQKAASAQYLGVMISATHSIKEEVPHRLSKATAAWKRMNLLWKRTEISLQHKILTYQAIMQAMLTHGLYTAQIAEPLLKQIDAFQLRGLRKILHIPTTWINR